MESNKTAVQRAIDTLQYDKSICADGDTRARSIYQKCIHTLESLLPVEKQQIIQAHTEGQALIFGVFKDRFKTDWSGVENVISNARSGKDNDVDSEQYYSSTYNPSSDGQR